MSEITIGNTTFKIRSIKRREMREHGLDRLGFGNHMYQAPMQDDGETIDVDKVTEGQEKAIGLVVDGGINALDDAGGNEAIIKVWRAILAKTYGLPGEEKNSSPSGPNAQTKTE